MIIAVIAPGAWAAYTFDRPRHVGLVQLVLDSNMERSIALRGPGWQEPFPDALPKAFRVETLDGGQWTPVAHVTRNTQRLVPIKEIQEYSIGHSIIARAMLVGLDRAVREMLAIING